MWKRFMIAAFLVVYHTAVFAQTDPQQQAEDAERNKVYFYQWIDNKGVIHVTDGLGKVPEKYRDKATKLEQPQRESTGRGGPASVTAPADGFSEQDAVDADRKAEWQQRMKDAKQRLTDAEQRYQALEQKRQEVLRRYGGPALGRNESLVESQRIEREMEEVKQDVEAARQEVENTIPDEARRAGVPPGWLRE